MLDDKLLGKIIINLVNNAIKFTPEGGTVTVSLTKNNNNHIQLTVADTGIGIL